MQNNDNDIVVVFWHVSLESNRVGMSNVTKKFNTQICFYETCKFQIHLQTKLSYGEYFNIAFVPIW